MPTTLAPNTETLFDAAMRLIWANQIDKIKLNNANITDAKCTMLAAALANNTAVAELYLENNSLSDICAKALATMLCVNTALQFLNLQFNLIGSDGAAALAAALRINRVLFMLWLGGNIIGDTGVLALIDALPIGIGYLQLTLQGNAFTAIALTALFEALRFDIVLAELNLSGNIINDVVMSILAAALKVNTNMFWLTAQNCAISTNAAKELAQGLLSNKQCIRLDLWDNAVGDNGAVALAQLSRWQYLNLGANSITTIGARAVASMIKMSSSLQSVALHQNAIGDDGFLLLLNALEKNYGVTDLALDINNYQLQFANFLSRNLQCAQLLLPYLICPIILINEMTISPGEHIAITFENLYLTDPNHNPINGNFTIQAEYGSFFNAHNQVITQFSPLDIEAGGITFRHNGSHLGPIISVIASCGNLSTWPMVMLVNFTLLDLTVRYAQLLINYTAVFNHSFSLAIPGSTFSAPQGALLDYSAHLQNGSLLPAWMHFNETTQTFSGIAGALGHYVISIIAASSINTSTKADFNFQVVPETQLPANNTALALAETSSSTFANVAMIAAIIGGVIGLLLFVLVLYQRWSRKTAPSALSIEGNPPAIFEIVTPFGSQTTSTQSGDSSWGIVYDTGADDTNERHDLAAPQSIYVYPRGIFLNAGNNQEKADSNQDPHIAATAWPNYDTTTSGQWLPNSTL